jgi:hypothetical protein
MKQKISNPINVLFIIIAFHLFLGLTWILLDKSPLPPDPSNHSLVSIMLKECIQTHTASTLSECLNTSRFYPPFAQTIVALLMMLFGISISLPRIVSLFFYLLGLIGVYFWTKEVYFDKKTAIITVALSAFIPDLYSMARFFWLEIPLFALVFWTLFFLAKSQNMTRKFNLFLSFLLLAMGILTKWTFVVYVFVPFFIAFIRSIQKQGLAKTFFVCLVGISLVLALALPWYLRNYEIVLKGGVYTSLSDFYNQSKNIWQKINELTTYLKWYINFGIQFPYFLVLMLCIPCFIKSTSKEVKYYIFVSVLMAYFIFSLLVLKDSRYMIPVTPFLFSIAAYVAAKNNLIKALTYLWIIFLVLQFIKFSFNVPSFNFRPMIEVLPKEWLNFIHYDASQYPANQLNTENNWPNNKIVDDLAELSEGKTKNILVIGSWQRLNDRYMDLYAKTKGYNNLVFNKDFPLEFINKKLTSSDKEQLVEYIKTKDYILVPELEWAQSYALFKPQIDPLQDVLITNMLTNINVVKTYQIPENEVKTMLKELRKSEDKGTRYEACENNKCDKLLLFQVNNDENISNTEIEKTFGIGFVPDTCSNNKCLLSINISPNSFSIVQGAVFQKDTEEWNYDASKKQTLIWAFQNRSNFSQVITLNAWPKANNYEIYKVLGQNSFENHVKEKMNNNIETIKNNGGCTDDECSNVGFGIWNCTGKDENTICELLERSRPR